MLSINMRVFKSILLLSALFSSALSLPLEMSSTEVPLLPTTQSGDLYDQRQNGTENYRIHVDGLVFVIAPAEALLLAGGDPSLTLSGQNEIPKPQEKPKPEPEPLKPISAPKSAHRFNLRLTHLLAPLLRRISQE